MKPIIRGKVSDEEIKRKAQAFFGDQFGVAEVLLLLYVNYCLKNGGSFSYSACTDDELELLAEWCDKNWLGDDDDGKIWCKSKEFYDIMCEILWDAYVVHE